MTRNMIPDRYQISGASIVSVTLERSVRRPMNQRQDKAMDEKEKAVMNAGVQYGMQMIQQMPKGDRLEVEAHITGVLCVFWGALWETFGTEYARDFIEAQLRSMEPDVPHERFTEPRVH